MKYCPVYKKCGACQLINMPYQEQLTAKYEYIRKLYHGKKTEPIIGMKDPYHYRHKVYASFEHDRAGVISAGLYEESTHKIVKTDMCLIQSVTANKIIADLCHIATKLHIPAYSEKSGQGVLRHAYIRVSHAEHTVLLVLVIGSRQLPASHEFVRELRTLHPEISTIILNYNHEHTSMVLGPREKILYGPGYIEDAIAGIHFRISSRSFYQVNPVQTEILYEKALELAGLTPEDSVLDMCCGVGTISLCAAKKAGFVTGVEINPDAVKDAVKNAERNHIDNVRFVHEDAEAFMRRYSRHPDAVFLDPPRAGFSASFLHALAAIHPEKIIYISCNPETQARDTSVLYREHYRIGKIIPVDMFPFTRNVECIALLEKSS